MAPHLGLPTCRFRVVDIGTAIVTIAVGAIAVLPRVSALSGPGREQAAIQRDCELWRAMPEGAVRDRLGSVIGNRTEALLRERRRDKTVENAWRYGSAWLAVAWVVLVLSTAVTSDAAWAGHVRTALEVGGIITGAVGAFLVLLVGALVGWKAVLRLWRRLRGPVAITYEI